MRIDKQKLENTGFFSDIFIDYVNRNPVFKPFINQFPDIDDIEKVIKAKKFSKERRVKLFEELISQYKDVPAKEAVLENIQSLVKDNCFTVTTGHQLNIFTGPLFFIYKVITVLNACKKLNLKYPEYKFVPVFWMASEDHDFEEISNFRLFGKDYKWEIESKGPVGRLNPGSLKSILDQLPENVKLFEDAYLKFNRLSESVRYYVNELFGKYGLVVIEPDTPDFKSFLKDVIVDDLTKFTAHRLVENTSAELAGNGYKSQVTPREINLFYMNDHMRNRIVYENGNYQVLDTDMVFSKDDLLKEVRDNPQNFSPNVILRPVYQELILPNISYVGGPAEIAYWIQLKKVFNYYKIQFPVLLPRNFVLYINKSIAARIDKLSVKHTDLFLDSHHLKTKYILEKNGSNVNLEKEVQILQELFESIKYKAISVDKSLEGFIGAEYSKTLKIFDNIEKRILKSEEKNQETSLRQLESVKEKLFPEGKLQERTENFLNFYINNPEFIDSIIESLDPFDQQFNILSENVT